MNRVSRGMSVLVGGAIIALSSVSLSSAFEVARQVRAVAPTLLAMPTIGTSQMTLRAVQQGRGMLVAFAASGAAAPDGDYRLQSGGRFRLKDGRVVWIDAQATKALQMRGNGLPFGAFGPLV